jgi:predicted nucleic acid-binding protein
MRYLLDVNALVALGLLNHEFHSRVSSWLSSQRDAELLTCSITELGFVRVLAQAPGFALSVQQGRNLLLRMKRNKAVPFAFLTDSNDISKLPGWVKATRQTTDGHLLELASTNRATLATFDRGIPGAHLIP